MQPNAASCQVQSKPSRISKSRKHVPPLVLLLAFPAIRRLHRRQCMHAVLCVCCAIFLCCLHAVCDDCCRVLALYIVAGMLQPAASRAWSCKTLHMGNDVLDGQQQPRLPVPAPVVTSLFKMATCAGLWLRHCICVFSEPLLCVVSS